MHWKIGPSNGTPQPRSLINPILIGSNECLVTYAALCKYIRYNGFESGDRGLIVAQRSLKSVESINLFSRFPSATGFIPPPIVSKVRPIQLKRKTYFPKGLRLKINILRRGIISSLQRFHVRISGIASNISQTGNQLILLICPRVSTIPPAVCRDLWNV